MKKRKLTSEFYLACFVVLVFVILALVAPGFYSINNMMSILNIFSYTIIGAIGMNLIMLTGNIDISAGSIMSVAAIACAGLGYLNVTFPGLLLCGIVVGGLLCLLNGFLTVKLNVPSMVVTLGTSQIFSGILPIFNEATLYNLPSTFTWFAYEAKLFGIIPGSFLLAVVIVVAFLLIMKYSRFSKQLYAIGNNPKGAHLIGVRVNKTLLITYLIAGCLFGVCAVVIVTAAARVTNVMGSGMEFTLISAVILGGTSPAGGSGKIIGTVLGALVLSMVSSAIQHLGLPMDYQDVIKGVIILVTVVAGSAKNLHRRRNIALEKERMAVR